MMSRVNAASGLDFVRDVIDWWIGHLKNSVAELARNTFAKAAPAPIIIEASRAGYRMPGIENPVSAEELPDSIRQFMQSSPAAGKEICLRLAPDRYLQRLLAPKNLPTSRKRLMAQMDIAANTPIEKQAVYMFFPERSAATPISDYVIVRRETVDGAIAAIRLAGGRLAAIDAKLDDRFVCMDSTPFGAILTRSSDKTVRKSCAALAIFSAVMFLHAAWTLDQKFDFAEKSVSEEIENIREAAVSARQDIDAHNRKLRQLMEFAEKNRATLTKVQLLDVLSGAVPDTAYLRDLEIRADRLKISGYASSGTSLSLIALLEANPLFHDVTFSAPLGSGPDGMSEQFSLEMRVVRP